MNRLFVAVAPDATARASAAGIRDRVRVVAPAAARWVPDDALHVTLAFPGAVDPELVPSLRSALASAVRVIPSFEAALGMPGAFPSPARPRVLWIGVQSIGDALTGLAGAVRHAIRAFPVEHDERPFRPHLTIARLRVPARTPALAEDLSRVALPAARTWQVKDVTLYESLPGGGARYEALATVPLAAPAIA